MGELYQILEISHRATLDEIKASYRRLAKIYHPDANPDSSKERCDHFQKIRHAYGILSDPEQRILYDTECKKNGFKYQSQYSKDFSADDLFAYMSRQFNETDGENKTGDEKPQTFSYSLKLTFVEACLGGTKSLTIDGKKTDIAIPSGITHKSTLEIPCDNGKRAIIMIYVATHPSLKREQQNICLDLPITLSESVSGGKVEIPTLHGPVMLHIPPSTKSGTILTLKGKGISGKKQGDQLVRILVTPPKDNTQALQTLLKEWEKTNPYNPRQGIS
jgi:DnaJ-class molecular chaperone